MNQTAKRYVCFKKNIREKVCKSFYLNGAQVEIVEQYKYVGCVFSSRANVFTAHVKYTHDKAMYVFYINMGSTWTKKIY